MKKIAFYFLFVSLLASCSIPQQMTTEAPQNNTKTIQEEPPTERIIFLGFNIYGKKSTEPNAIKLASKTIHPGFLKKDVSAVPTLPKGKIRCSLLDASKQPIKSTLLDNPLYKHAEYTKEHAGHDHGSPSPQYQLDRQIIECDSAYFAFRARYDASIRFVQVEAVDEEGNPSGVALFEL